MAEDKEIPEGGTLETERKKSSIEKQKSRIKIDSISNLYSLGTISVEEFLEASSVLTEINQSSLFVVDLRASSYREGTLRAALPTCQNWFDIPIAAIERISPIAPGCNNDPAKPLVSVVFREEFKSLTNTFQQLSFSQKSQETDLSPLFNYGQLECSALRRADMIGSEDFSWIYGPYGLSQDIGSSALPPRGTCIRFTFRAGNNLQRILVKQNNRVIGYYYRDVPDPRTTACIDSDGGDIDYEFQEYHGDSWRAYRVTSFRNESTGANKKYVEVAVMDRGTAQLTIEWGPNITHQRANTLHIDGKVKCGGILFFNLVATSYAFAWVTASNGEKVSVRDIWVELGIPCRDFRHRVSAQNTSEVSAGEQFRGIGVPICCDIVVKAGATTMDGRTLTAGPNTYKAP